MKWILMLTTIVPVSFCSAVQALTPLYYRTYAVARLEACVESDRTVSLQPPEIERHVTGETRRAELGPHDSVQKISLRILKVKDFSAKDKTVPLIHEGQIIEVTNPYLDQATPFKPGDQIEARLRLVLPEEQFLPNDPRQQWWFFPKEEPEDILAPRHPFIDVDVIR